MLGASMPPSGKLVDTIGLIVNNHAVPISEIEEDINTYFLERGKKVPPMSSPSFKKAKTMVVNNLIETFVLDDEAQREQLTIDSTELENQVKNQLKAIQHRFANRTQYEQNLEMEGITQANLRQAIQRKLKQQFLALRAVDFKKEEFPNSVYISDKETHAYFKKHQADFQQVNFSIILFKILAQNSPYYVAQVRHQANQVMKRIENGFPFSKAVQKYSDDPGTRSTHGDVGTLYAYQINPALFKGILAIPPHHLGIIQTSSGIYIVRINSKIPSDYSDVASKIQQELKAKKENAFLKNWISQLKKKAYIKMFLPN